MPSSERSLRGRLGAYTLHARYDARETTAPARRALLQRFEDEVDPERKLPEAERARRAEAARKAYMTRLALKSRVTRERKAKKQAAH